MKTIGLLGGMSWESTASYYNAINEGIKVRLGGLHSAKIVLYSLDFDPIEKLQHAGKWDELAGILTDAARKIQAAGADFLVICTNTMHKVAPQIEAGIEIPLLHIADAAAKKIKDNGYTTVGLLGTKFTMEQDFYKTRLLEKYNIKTVIPPRKDRDLVHHVIYNQLCLGKIEDRSRAEYLRIIDSLAQNGAEAVILACTEIPMLIARHQCPTPLLDTTQIHAAGAVNRALS